MNVQKFSTLRVNQVPLWLWIWTRQNNYHDLIYYRHDDDTWLAYLPTDYLLNVLKFSHAQDPGISWQKLFLCDLWQCISWHTPIFSGFKNQFFFLWEPVFLRDICLCPEHMVVTCYIWPTYTRCQATRNKSYKNNFLMNSKGMETHFMTSRYLFRTWGSPCFIVLVTLFFVWCLSLSLASVYVIYYGCTHDANNSCKS